MAKSMPERLQEAEETRKDAIRILKGLSSHTLLDIADRMKRDYNENPYPLIKKVRNYPSEISIKRLRRIFNTIAVLE